MGIASSSVRSLIHNLTSESAVVRARAGDEVTDWIGSYTDHQAEMLVNILVWLASAEVDQVALEAELHAAAEIVENHPISTPFLSNVDQLDRNSLDSNLWEYYDFLHSSSNR